MTHGHSLQATLLVMATPAVHILLALVVTIHGLRMQMQELSCSALRFALPSKPTDIVWHAVVCICQA